MGDETVGSDEFLMDHHDEDVPLEAAGSAPVLQLGESLNGGRGRHSGSGSSSLSGAGPPAVLGRDGGSLNGSIRASSPAGSTTSVHTSGAPPVGPNQRSGPITTVTRNQQITLVGPRGTSPSPPPTNPPWMIAQQTTQTIICLLYTSPSPRDQRGSRMPSSA